MASQSVIAASNRAVTAAPPRMRGALAVVPAAAAALRDSIAAARESLARMHRLMERARLDYPDE